jgi:RimJ/RimL family protein N-acetyltransferase
MAQASALTRKGMEGREVVRASGALLLVGANEGDAEALYKIWKKYEVTKYTMIKDIGSIEDCRARIARHLGWGRRVGPFLVTMDGGLIGYCGARINEVGRAELFYNLDDSAWGSGYGTDVARALAELAFRDKRVSFAGAEAVVDNIASWRVLEKIGMRRIGVRKGGFENRDGRFDVYVYELADRG